ncbi:MAG: AgmX/PglI C-terminal domain-containing protein [Polyangia bacterium]
MRINAILFAMGSCLALGACASTSGSGGDEPLPVVVRDGTQPSLTTGGIPPDKQADIYLVLQERDASARKCYQDVLNEKHTREFKGTVKLMLSLNTDGTAKAVRIMGGTLGNKEVEDCLVQTVKEFEFPKLERAGDLQYEYTFEPQY